MNAGQFLTSRPNIFLFICLLIVSSIIFVHYDSSQTMWKAMERDDVIIAKLNRLDSLVEGSQKESATQLPSVDTNTITADNIELVQKLYASQAQERTRILKRLNDDFVTLYNILVPEVFCPSLVRVGFVNDGGKWICNPWATPKDCVMYSLGLNGEMSFEQQFQDVTGKACQIRGYDMKKMTPSYTHNYEAINGKVFQKTLNTTKGNTISDLMEQNGDKSMEVLKIDIEGAELTVLAPFLQQHTPCMIFIEMHGKASEMMNLISSIARHDYKLFFFEINASGQFKATEYSFVHASCQNRYKMIPLADYLKDV